MRITKWALVAAVLLTTSPAFANNGSKGDWELGVLGGYGMLDNYGTLEPKNNLFYGGRLGYFFSRHFSLEATAQRLGTESNSLPTNRMNLNSYRGNAVFNFAVESKLRPFLTAGAGYENTDIKSIDNSSNFAWNAGGGLRLMMTPMWSLRADGRYNRNKIDALNETENNFEVGMGLSMMFGGGGEEEPTPVMPPPAAPNQPPSVSVVADRSEILPGESANLTATATDPEGGPVTLDWSATSGHVNPAGTTATLGFDGTNPPATSTVTVRATDDHGNTSSSEVAVRLDQPAPPPEAVSCLAGGFPRNLSRLTNVDKACLDDYSTRLKSDPGARVIVVGHADGRENSRVAQQRAVAVKDYLVTSGIEGSRITTRTTANGTAVNTGTEVDAQASARSVEVWFVPAGAKGPGE